MTRTLIEARVGFRFHISGEQPPPDPHAALRAHEAAFGSMEQALRALPDWRRHLPGGPGPEDDSEDHYAQLCDIDLVQRDVDGIPCFCLWVRRDTEFDLEHLKSIRDAVVSVYQRSAQAAGMTAAYKGAESMKIWRVIESQALAGL